MSTTRTPLFTVTLALALLATAAAAGTTIAQSDDPLAGFDHDGDRLTVVNGTDQRIGGTTTLDAGTEIVVEVHGEDGFEEIERTTVHEDGSFVTTFDFSGAEAGTSFTATVLARNETSAWATISDEVQGTVSDVPTASFADDGGTLLVQNASEQTIRGETSLESGSEVLIQVRSGAGAEKPFLKTATATVSEDGTFAAAFDFSELPSDTSFTVSARANGTDLAEADGRIVDETSETTTTTAETTANDGGQPGFGAVAALVALCGAALVALHSERD